MVLKILMLANIPLDLFKSFVKLFDITREQP